MDKAILGQALKYSSFKRFLDINPYGIQLPSLIAVVKALKPAMDMWIRRDVWQNFVDLTHFLGLVYHVDMYFDRTLAKKISTQSTSYLTTTRAVRSEHFSDEIEAHVFIAKSKENLEKAINSGWYPLIIENRVINKHIADHEKFGHALGYPACCRTFFHKNNNWQLDNTYYASYLNGIMVPHVLSNGLLRHTAFTFIPHLPCSFSCLNTINYGRTLSQAIEEESLIYLQEIERRLASPTLCISELKIYRFDGYLSEPNQVRYNHVEPVNPTPITDPLYKWLTQGNICRIDSNIVRVYMNDSHLYAYEARADKLGPEIPFLVKCSSW